MNRSQDMIVEEDLNYQVCDPVAEYCRLTRPRFREPDLFGEERVATCEGDIRVVELFAGVGGFRIGLERASARFKTVWNNQWEPSTKRQDASIVYCRRFGALGHSNQDIATVPTSDIPQHDLLVGGFPCQDFSVAGKRNGFNSHKDHRGRVIREEVASEETRGKLYMWMKEVIEITKPKVFVAENVKGLVNLSNVKEVIQRDFSHADGDGYIVLEPRVLHAADYGVPQSRERVIFIGIRRSALNGAAREALSRETVPDEYNPYPAPTHAFHEKGKGLAAVQTVGRVFAGLEEPERSADPSQMYYSRARYMGPHCQGQTEVDMDGIGPTIRAEHHGNIEYRRLSEEHGGTLRGELERGLRERRLTPRECALIQTFPPDYEFVIPKEGSGRQFVLSPSAAYKIIGNAVPPLLAYHLGRRIESLWDLYFG